MPTGRSTLSLKPTPHRTDPVAASRLSGNISIDQSCRVEYCASSKEIAQPHSQDPTCPTTFRGPSSRPNHIQRIPHAQPCPRGPQMPNHILADLTLDIIKRGHHMPKHVHLGCPACGPQMGNVGLHSPSETIYMVMAPKSPITLPNNDNGDDTPQPPPGYT